MKLLNLKIVKKKKSDEVANHLAFIEKVKKTEQSVVRSLNETLEKEQLDRARLKDFATKDIPELTVEKEILLQQVVELEKRKKKSLEPITALKKESETILAENKKHREELLEKIAEVKDERERIVENAESVINQREELDDREMKIHQKEKSFVASENKIRESSKQVGEEWLKYYDAVNRFNDDVEWKMKDIDAKKKANEEYRSSLYKREQDIVLRNKKLQDERRTLNRAWRELKDKS